MTDAIRNEKLNLKHLNFKHPEIDYVYRGIAVTLKYGADIQRLPGVKEYQRDLVPLKYSGEKATRMEKAGFALRVKWFPFRKVGTKWVWENFWPKKVYWWVVSEIDFLERRVKDVNEYLDTRIDQYEDHIKDFDRLEGEIRKN